MNKTFIVLANSIRGGFRCIAGRETTEQKDHLMIGPWIRPVSPQGEGEVRPQESLCADGTQPAVLDVVRTTLVAKQDCPHQPENYILDASQRWEKLRTFPRDNLSYLEEHPVNLWLSQADGHTDRIHPDEAITSVQPFQSLYLIRPQGLKFKIWYDGVYNKKQRRTIFTYNGIEYDLSITDPTVDAKYFQPFPTLNLPLREIAPADSTRCFIVVSLTAPFRDGYHYKLVATILEY